MSDKLTNWATFKVAPPKTNEEYKTNMELVNKKRFIEDRIEAKKLAKELGLPFED